MKPFLAPFRRACLTALLIGSLAGCASQYAAQINTLDAQYRAGLIDWKSYNLERQRLVAAQQVEQQNAAVAVTAVAAAVGTAAIIAAAQDDDHGHHHHPPHGKPPKPYGHPPHGPYPPYRR